MIFSTIILKIKVISKLINVGLKIAKLILLVVQLVLAQLLVMKNVSHQTEDTIVQHHIIKKANNTTKSDFSSLTTINNLRDEKKMEDKRISHSYDMETVNFLDNRNFNSVEKEEYKKRIDSKANGLIEKSYTMYLNTCVSQLV